MSRGAFFRLPTCCGAFSQRRVGVRAFYVRVNVDFVAVLLAVPAPGDLRPMTGMGLVNFFFH